MNRFSCLSSFFLVMALTTGCLLGPDYTAPEAPADLPEAFRDAPAADPAVQADWLAAWNDPLLSELVAEGLSTNLTLQAAQSRLAQSRASLSQARAALFPSLGLSASASANKTYDPSDSSESYRGGADAGWELDLFGRNRRSAEASEADLEAAGYTLADAKLSLESEIISDYVALRLAQESLDIARTNLAADLRSAEIARAKGESGFTSGSDVAAAEASIATSRAALPAREAAVSACARALELLLARAPFSLEEKLDAKAPIPVAPAPPSIAPADVLARRPDVRKAAANLHAATARIGAVRAARYPAINLAAGATISADSLSGWSDGMKSLSIGPSVSLPLFQGGRLKAAEEQARAAANESLINYHDTVLSAVHETQNGWVKLAAERARTEDLEAAVKHDIDALDAAEELYRVGQGSYTTVLQRQTALLSARQALAQHRADLATLTVSLVKSLGGAL